MLDDRVSRHSPAMIQLSPTAIARHLQIVAADNPHGHYGVNSEQSQLSEKEAGARSPS